MQPEINEHIEQYLLGKMTSQQTLAFEQQMAQDPTLGEEVNLQRQIFEALRREPELAAFRAQMALIEKKMEDEKASGKTAVLPSVRRLAARQWLALAAGLLILAVAGWWFLGQTTTDPQALFQAHFTPPEQLTTTSARRNAESEERGTPTTSDDRWNGLWDVLEQQYARQDFNAALATLQQIQALDPNEDYASETFFYAGLIHLRNQQPALSLVDFSKVTVGHTEDRDWYSALALLALGRKEEAKAMFEKMIKENHPRQKEVREIMKKRGLY